MPSAATPTQARGTGSGRSQLAPHPKWHVLWWETDTSDPFRPSQAGGLHSSELPCVSVGAALHVTGSLVQALPLSSSRIASFLCLPPVLLPGRSLRREAALVAVTGGCGTLGAEAQLRSRSRGHLCPVHCRILIFLAFLPGSSTCTTLPSTPTTTGSTGSTAAWRSSPPGSSSR